MLQANSMFSAKESEACRIIPPARQSEYLNEVENFTAASHLLKHKPDYTTREYFNNTIIPSVLPNPVRPSVVYNGNGNEVDLRTVGRTTAANSRSHNNGLNLTGSEIAQIASNQNSPLDFKPAIDLTGTMTSPDDSSIEMTVVSKHKSTSTKLDYERVTRMKKQASKKLHVTKSLKKMSEEEKEDRKAAQKTVKLYEEMLSNGTSATEIESIKYGLGEDDNVAFCSETYNDAYMNMYGYDEE